MKDLNITKREKRKLTTKKLFRYVRLVFGTIIAVQLLNIILRTCQVILEHHPRSIEFSSDMSQKPICQTSYALEELIWLESLGDLSIDEASLIQIVREQNSINLDADGDGLTAWDEFWNMTSDEDSDSDDDGLDDSRDYCPNCWIETYYGHIKTYMFNKILQKRVSGICFVVSEDGIESSAESCRVVLITELEFYFLRDKFAMFRDAAIYEGSWFRFHNIISVPGLFFLYEYDYYCGKRCGFSGLSYVVDLPLIGPVFLGESAKEYY